MLQNYLEARASHATLSNRRRKSFDHCQKVDSSYYDYADSDNESPVLSDKSVRRKRPGSNLSSEMVCGSCFRKETLVGSCHQARRARSKGIGISDSYGFHVEAWHV